MSELNNDAEKLRQKIFERLSRFERQSDNGTHMNIRAEIGAGLLWETSQDIRLFLKYLQDHYEKPRAQPLAELSDFELAEMYSAMRAADSLVWDNQQQRIANAARKWLEGLK